MWPFYRGFNRSIKLTLFFWTFNKVFGCLPFGPFHRGFIRLIEFVRFFNGFSSAPFEKVKFLDGICHLAKWGFIMWKIISPFRTGFFFQVLNSKKVYCQFSCLLATSWFPFFIECCTQCCWSRRSPSLRTFKNKVCFLTINYYKHCVKMNCTLTFVIYNLYHLFYISFVS
jgi:hypothetical protein